MQVLYPEIEASSTYQLKSDDIHSLYVEECGNPAGIPVIFVHGGPGGGCNENHRRYFDPARYRIIIFDQRGAGRSLPAGEVRENTSQFLIRDMELIRETLGIDTWMLFGGSWGATLSLLYAQTYPDRVRGMVLRGTFLARQSDLDWFTKGIRRIFPDYWYDFVGAIPEQEREDIILAYYNRVHGHDKENRIRFARAWAEWAGRIVSYSLPEQIRTEEEDMERVLQDVSIETHYARHKYFIEEDQILMNAGELPDVPIKIIHGRKDLTCTLDTSWTLHKALPQSEMLIIREGGHLAGEPVMIDVLVNATDDMASQLG